MMELLNALLLVGILLASSALGLYIRPLLAEHHRSQDTLNLVRLVTTMLVTFAALVLGLLTSSVKTTRDTVNTDLRGFAAMIIELDQTLREYGPETDLARQKLRSYTASAIATTWPGETLPAGDYYPRQLPPDKVEKRIENSQLGNMLIEIELDIRRLRPQDAMQRRLADDGLGDFQQVVQRRWKLIEEASASIDMPFYIVLVFWLAVVFASFGLCAPRNMLVLVMLALGAVSIASAIFVILVYDRPFGGLFPVPSQPLRAALVHLSQ